uniref:Uncharacterized protein n=1 Tax=Octopus bimaculoides TaxID=37653 RepID=A0A0L8H9M5_OCTBM
MFLMLIILIMMVIRSFAVMMNMILMLMVMRSVSDEDDGFEDCSPLAPHQVGAPPFHIHVDSFFR